LINLDVIAQRLAKKGKLKKEHLSIIKDVKSIPKPCFEEIPADDYDYIAYALYIKPSALQERIWNICAHDEAVSLGEAQRRALIAELECEAEYEPKDIAVLLIDSLALSVLAMTGRKLYIERRKWEEEK
jgi:hypothetical protein